MKPLLHISTVGIFCVLLSACGKSSSSGTGHDISISRVQPPVKDTAGAAMTSAALRMRLERFTPQSANLEIAIQERFFSTGPTDVLNILADVDSRLAGIETQAKSASKCLDNTPTDVTLTLFGEPQTFSFQCFETVGNGVIAFGKKDTTWSIYVMIGAGPIAAKSTDLGDGKTSVEVWGAVGTTNTPTWDSMSYVGFHISANNQTGDLEMTMGGMGVGFCGVTLKADGTNMYAYGSTDSGSSCDAIASSCVLMTDLISSGTCGNIDQTHFALTGLGRASVTGTGTGNIPATWGASPYPVSGPTLTLNGTASDMTAFGISTAADLPATVTDIAAN